MDSSIYCLVDASGRVYVKDGAASYSEVAAPFQLDPLSCDAYRFDLAARHLFEDRGKPASETAARRYWEQHVGSPEKLMDFAAGGHLTKHVLESLLGAEDASAYLDACAIIEKRYTVDCGAKDTCMEAGCALEGDVCLQPLLSAGPEYHKECGAAWRRLFEDPHHRIPAWVH